MENNYVNLTLDMWNRDISKQMIPITILYVLFMILSIFGNFVVIFLYKCRPKWHHEDRYFIPWLAAVDLLCGVHTASFNIALTLSPVKFDSDGACKASWFIGMLLVGLSGLLLLVIAVQRYLKICRPLGPQMTLRWKRLMLFLTAVISTVIVWPSVIFYGMESVSHKNNDVFGSACTSVRRSWTHNEPLIFKGACMVIILIVLVALVVLYSCIGRVIYKRMRSTQALTSWYVNGNTKSDTIIELETELSTKTGGLGEDYVGNSTGSLNIELNKRSHNNANSVSSLTTENAPEQTNKATNSEITVTQGEGIKKTNKRTFSTKLKRQEMSPGVRFSMMMMLITVIFVVSYFIKIGIMYRESYLENENWVNLPTREMLVLRFLESLFLVNNIANPFIYGLFDTRFRNEFKKVFCCCQVQT